MQVRRWLGSAVVLLGLVLLWMVHSTPAVTELRFENPPLTSLMEARRGAIDQRWVPLERISPQLHRAVVVAEDADFYHHNGIDFREMRKSFKKNWHRKSYARGFSTITMQLVKNLYLSEQKTLFRKARQIVISWRLERELSKERILELYLNVVEWGSGIYGAEAAAQHYSRKSAADLSPFEAAFLAAILPNPRGWGTWPPGPSVRRRQMAILSQLGP